MERRKKTHYTIAAAATAAVAARSHRHAFSVSLLELEEREKEQKTLPTNCFALYKVQWLLFNIFTISLRY